MARQAIAANESKGFTNYIRVGACLAVAFGVLRSLFGSWLTANEFTELGTEIEWYLWSFLLVLFGGLIYAFYPSNGASWLKAASVLGMAVAVCIVFESCKYSDDSFFFWKIKAVKPEVWKQLVSDLRMLDKKWQEFHDDEPHFIPRDKAPRSFDTLALPADWSGVHSGVRNHPIMVCGGKSRTWGLVLGSVNFAGGRWATYKRVQVGEDVWFFEGLGD